MIDTLNIGEYIYNSLNNDLIKGLGVNKIAPLVVDNGVLYPYIVYRRTNLESNSCKDGYYEDIVFIEITICAETYILSIDIANSVRKCLEKQQITYKDMEISDSYLISASEIYDNAFIQKLQFKLKIN